ncbi:MAG: Gldg family protein, partial [Polyangiales bacterium]
FLGASNYVANAKNVKEDVSYFKTTEPSDSTLKMVERLGEPVRVILFFPKVNEVYEEVKPYFDSLDKRSKKLKVTVKDHALEPELARKHRVRSNGFVVLLKGEGKGQQSENFEIGTKVEEARDRLKKLDGNFQKVFTKLTTVRREIHVTTGHRERSAGGADGDSPPERTAQLKVALERSNIKTRDLGLSQGLAQQVPAGAPAVAVIGPRTAFLVEEARSLLRYVQEGGRLIVMVDPDVEHGLDPLLHGLGLALQPGVIASTRSHLRRTQSNADRGIVFSATYSAHPTVTTASRNAGRVATIFYNGGHLGRHQGEGALSGLNVVFPLRSDPAFWRDLNGDFEQSAEEKSEAMNMMAAVTVKGKGGKEGRAVVIADGDFVTDQLIRNPGNILVLGDILQWLLGQEQIVGEASSEEDVRIEHTRDEDKLWFYATSFGVPVPVLALGVWMAMRRRRRKESK